MSNYMTHLDHMLACWNSETGEDIRANATAALEHNVHFVDPNHNIIGVEAFINMVKMVKEQVPGAIYSRASKIDMQNNFCRYHWAVHKDNVLLLEGFDVTEVNDSGKVVKVIGFFGTLKPTQ